MSDLTVIFALIFVAASLAIYGVYWVFVFNRRAQQDSQSAARSRPEHSTIRRPFWRPCGGNEASATQTNPILRQLQRLAHPDRNPRAAHIPRSGVRGALPGVDAGLQFAAWAWGSLSLVARRFGRGRRHVVYLALERSRRIFAFTEQLPDAIDVIVRGVRVGLPFSSAVALVAREMPDPVGTEFGMLADEIVVRARCANCAGKSLSSRRPRGSVVSDRLAKHSNPDRR